MSPAASTWHTRPARRSDLSALAAVERRAWPCVPSMQASVAKLRVRIEQGLVVVAANHAGTIGGFLASFRPRWADAGAIAALLDRCPSLAGCANAQERWAAVRDAARLPANWAEATDDGWLDRGHAHDPDGAIVFGIGLTTDPSVRGTGIARRVLADAFRRERATGAQLFVGYGRLPHYGRCPATTLPEYLAKTDPRGAPWDPGLRVHWWAGARPLARPGETVGFIGIPGAMPTDAESRGNGALIITQLGRE